MARQKWLPGLTGICTVRFTLVTAIMLGIASVSRLKENPTHQSRTRTFGDCRQPPGQNGLKSRSSIFFGNQKRIVEHFAVKNASSDRKFASMLRGTSSEVATKRQKLELVEHLSSSYTVKIFPVTHEDAHCV